LYGFLLHTMVQYAPFERESAPGTLGRIAAGGTPFSRALFTRVAAICRCFAWVTKKDKRRV
jgi:hypothetical protein